MSISMFERDDKNPYFQFDITLISILMCLVSTIMIPLGISLINDSHLSSDNNGGEMELAVLIVTAMI